MPKFFLLLIITSLSSCSLFVEPMPSSWNWGAKPRPLTGIKNFPSTESEYGKGFKDGCGAGWEAVTKGLLGDINDKRFDYKRHIKSPDYNNGWWDGYEQCTYVVDWEIT